MAEMFQKRVLNKYIKNHIQQNEKLLDERYAEFCKTFCNKEKQANILVSKEEQYQEGFLRELFVASLGYTINPDVGFNLITEEKNVQNSKKADGAVKVAEKVVAVIELKDHKTQNLELIEAQAFKYRDSHDCNYVITSNFEKLRFYIKITRQYIDFHLFNMTKEDFITLHLLLSFESIKADVPATIKNESIVEEEDVTDKLYQKYSAFKKALFADLIQKNPEKDTLQLFKKSQKLLDRLLFILFAEDRGLLPVNTIDTFIQSWKATDSLLRPTLYGGLKKYFSALDTGNADKNIFAYNGGLFKPDEFLDSLIISDSILEKHIPILSAYDFETDVSVNILGHIFEHSLTEIEKITNAINEGIDPLTLPEPKKSKTKNANQKNGVFYTPPYITQYIVENTIGALCTQKKAELELHEEDYFADKKPSKPIKAKLNEKLIEYREWLKKLTICDPACGSGAFLVAALDFLMKEHKKLDEMYASLFDDMIVFDGIEMEILENNLFGVDINEESVEICKLSLWLHTAKPKRKLNTLSNNIKCGNSLISDKTFVENAFNWQEEFPHVFAQGGFDVVIGNPPYIRRTQLDEIQKKVFEDIYFSAYKQYDLYVLFNELATLIIKKYGKIGFIQPNKFLSSEYGTKINNFLIDNCTIEAINNVAYDNVFSEASVYPYIFIFSKNKEEVNTSIVLKELSLLEYSKELIGFNSLTDTSKIIGKINKSSIYIKDISKSIKRGVPNSKIEFGEEFTLSAIKSTFLSLPYATPTERLKIRYLKDSDKLEKYKEFSQDLILLPRTVLKIRAIIHDNVSHILDRIYYFPIDSSNYLQKYIISVLNSSLLTFYYDYMYGSTKIGGGYIDLKGSQIENFPIPKISLEDQAPFIELADKMIQLNEAFSKSKNKFLERIKDNLQPKTMSGILEKFYTFEFSAFMTELKKQKVTLSLKQQDEWEPYFNDYKKDCSALLEDIEATDMVINQKVYNLYGLTPEEIAIVEAN